MIKFAFKNVYNRTFRVIIKRMIKVKQLLLISIMKCTGPTAIYTLVFAFLQIIILVKVNFAEDKSAEGNFVGDNFAGGKPNLN